MNFGIYKSPVGNIKIEENLGKITSIKISSRYPDKKLANQQKATTLTDKTARQLNEYFQGKRKNFDFPYHLKGTAFQKKVWQALLDIPYGKTRSYKEIAATIGSPKAYRAVGMANNKNPIAIAVPCHRVIGSKGELLGYGGGPDIKKALLDMEKKHKNQEKQL